MKDSDILREAKALLEKGWCKGELARDANGKHCAFESEEATQFCALGALERTLRTNGLHWNQSMAPTFLTAAASKNGIAFDNDSAKSVRSVLEIYDRAIELAEK